MAATDTRLTPPVALAVVIGLGDVAEALIGWSAYNTHRTASWAALYLFGAEAAAGVVILLLAVIAAGRFPAAATVAAGLAWLRLVAVAVATFLIVVGIGFPRPFDATLTFPVVLSVVDAVAGVLICSAIARRTA